MKFSMVAGRKAVHVPNHPKASNSGYILYSRYLVEKELGRSLSSDEHVHHINGNPHDDRIENLSVVSRAEHAKIHELGGKKLDYDLLYKLRKEGLGYKKISKRTGYPVSSVKSAVRSIERV